MNRRVASSSVVARTSNKASVWRPTGVSARSSLLSVSMVSGGISYGSPKTMLMIVRLSRVASCEAVFDVM